MTHHRLKRYATNLKISDYFILSHITAFVGEQVPLAVRTGTKVLDIGCGEQPLRERVEALGGIYTGADIAQNSTTTVDCICPITSIPLPDASVDVILCTEVMEHVPETEEAFVEMARVLRPGGTLILTTPFLYPLHEEPHDFVRLTPYQIERGARLAGLEVVSMEKAGNEVEVVASYLCRCLLGFRPPARRRVACRIFEIGCRWLQLFVNLAAKGFVRVFGRYLPRQAFLNTMCVLRRSGSAT